MKKYGYILLALLSAASLFSSCAKRSGADSESSLESEPYLGNNANNQIYMLFDYPWYDNAKSLIEKSALVITGEVMSVRDEVLNISLGEDAPTYLPHRVYTVAVSETYKGSYPSQTVEIKQPGGAMGEAVYFCEENADLQIGKSYLLFLSVYPNSPATLLNPYQAAYELETGKSSEDNNITMRELLGKLES